MMLKYLDNNQNRKVKSLKSGRELLELSRWVKDITPADIKRR
jgi:hypothetical protein